MINTFIPAYSICHAKNYLVSLSLTLVRLIADTSHRTLSPFLRPFSRWTWVGRYQNVSVLDFIGAKDDGGGGDKCSYKMCKAPVRSSPPTYHHPVIFTGRLPFLSPNQQCQGDEGRNHHTPRICSPQPHLEVFHPCLHH